MKIIKEQKGNNPIPFPCFEGMSIDDTFGDDNTAYLAGNSITSRAYFDIVCYLPVIKYLIV